MSPRLTVCEVLSPLSACPDHTQGIFPGRGRVIWRDWYTHNVVKALPGGNTTLSAPLGHINVHIRDGSALLLHAKPAYTIEETRQGPYSLLISLSPNHQAYGSAYIDDGISFPPGDSKTLVISAAKGDVVIKPEGLFHVQAKLQVITVLGISERPGVVTLQGRRMSSWEFFPKQHKLVVSKMTADLNGLISLKWN